MFLDNCYNINGFYYVGRWTSWNAVFKTTRIDFSSGTKSKTWENTYYTQKLIDTAGQ